MPSPPRKARHQPTDSIGQLTAATAWQGPLPPPDSLQQFNTVVENGAERVFRMAEIEQRHRLEVERQALEANVQSAKSEALAMKMGLAFGAIISISSVIAAVLAVMIGAHWSVPIALVGVPLMSTVRTIVLRK